LIRAIARFGVGENLLEAVEVLLFAAEEEFLQTFGKGVEVVGFFDKTVALADAAGLEDEVAVGFEVGEGLHDAGALGFEGGDGVVDLDRGPEAGFLSAGEEGAEELLAFLVVAEEDLIRGAEELEFVGGVEGGGGGDEAFQFEIGEEGVDDEGADVVDARKFVEREIEGLAGFENLVENAADGLGRGGVAVDGARGCRRR